MRNFIRLILCGAAFVAALHSQPALQGMGRSTAQCTDKDGDRYGVGPISALQETTTALASVGDTTITVSNGAGFFGTQVLAIDTLENIEIARVSAVSGTMVTLTAALKYAHASGVVVSTPECLGVDSDDTDATVHTSAQLLTKWGTLAVALSKTRGYNPLRMWFIVASGGNDTTCISGSAPVGAGSPCASLSPIFSHLQAGDAIIYRAGTYTVYGTWPIEPAVNGTGANPIIIMSYPGELAQLGSGGSMAIHDRSWYIIDGLNCLSASTACVNIGDSQFGRTANQFHDNIIRHVHGVGSTWGISGGGYDNFLIEENVFHGQGEHGIYVGAKGDLLSTNLTVRRNIDYDVGVSGIHINGWQDNWLLEENFSYSDNTSGFSIQNGPHNGTARSNICLNVGQSGCVEMSTYNAKLSYASSNVTQSTCDAVPTTPGCNCGIAQTQLCTCTADGTDRMWVSNYGSCPHPIFNNVIENISYFGGDNTGNGTSVAGVTVVQIGPQGQYPGGQCDRTECQQTPLSNNTIRNIVSSSYAASSTLGPIFIRRASDWTTTQIDGVTIYRNDPAHQASIITVDESITLSSNFKNYTCASAQTADSGIWAHPPLTGNCYNADPKFANTTASVPDGSGYLWASLFDLRLLPTSPAHHSGSTTTLPPYDWAGRAFTAGTPSMGALERQLYPNGFFAIPNTKITNTALGGAANVCPADGAGGSVCPPPGGMIGCGANGTPYPYQSQCHGVIDAWGSAVLRNKNGLEGLWIWNGGHNDYGGNEMYRALLNTTSPQMQRVTEPSVITNVDFSVGFSAMPSDGKPPARHTFGQAVYLPDQDALLVWNGSVFSNNGTKYCDLWKFDYATLAWSAVTPTGVTPACGTSTGAMAYNPISHTVLMYTTSGPTYVYNPATNVASSLTFGSGQGPYPNATVDTKRNWMYQIGCTNAGLSGCLHGVNGYVYRTKSPDTLAMDYTSLNPNGLTGAGSKIDSSCTTVVNSNAPGVAYDSVRDRFVIYPQDSLNVVWFMTRDDATDIYSCTSQTITGGPPSTGITAETRGGIYGRFRYVPSLDIFVLLNGFNQNVYSLNLNQTDPGSAACNITLSPTSPGPYTVGQSVSITATANSCGAGTLTWSSTGKPTGTSGCTSTGATCTVSGTASLAGVFSTSISVTDGSTNASSSSLAITVNAIPTAGNKQSFTGTFSGRKGK